MKKLTKNMMTLVLAATFIFAACSDEKINFEELTVRVNTHDAKYKIFRCASSEPVVSGNGRHLEDYFMLPEAGCYRVKFEPVDGYETPEPWEGALQFGTIELAIGEYVSIGNDSTLMLRGNIPEAWWWITADPSGDEVASGPEMWDEGLEWDSYVLEAWVASPSNQYTVHCGDVAGYKPVPVAHYVTLIVRKTKEVTCRYVETGTADTDDDDDDETDTDSGG